MEQRRDRGRAAAALAGPGAALVGLPALSLFYWNRPADGLATVHVVLGAVVAAALGLVLVIRVGGQMGPRVRLDPWLGAIGAAAIVSIASSPALPDTLARSALYLMVAIIAVTVACVHRSTGSVTTVWVGALALALLPFLVHAVVDIASWQGELRYLDVGVYGNLRDLGLRGFLVATAGSALVVLHRRSWWWSTAVTLVGLFTIVASGSRGALLAWAVSVAVLLVLRAGRHRREVASHATAAAGLALVAVWALDRTGLLRTPHLFGRLDQGLGSGGDVDEVTSGRLTLWSDAFEQFRADPWFGIGPDAYRLSECCGPTTVHAHNLLLQALMEFGIIGVLLLGVLIARAVGRYGGLRALLTGVRSTPENTALTAMLVALLAYSMIDGAYYSVYTLMNAAVLAGLWAVGMADSPARAPRPGRDQSAPMENAASRSWEE